jgi:hypothetical protein
MARAFHKNVHAPRWPNQHHISSTRVPGRTNGPARMEYQLEPEKIAKSHIFRICVWCAHVRPIRAQKNAPIHAVPAMHMPLNPVWIHATFLFNELIKQLIGLYMRMSPPVSQSAKLGSFFKFQIQISLLNPYKNIYIGHRGRDEVTNYRLSYGKIFFNRTTF